MRRVSRGIAGFVIAATALASPWGCATVRRGGDLDDAPLDRAELTRCAHEDPFASPRPVALPDLAGAYLLHMVDETGEVWATGNLDLRLADPADADTGDEADPLAGPPPVLVGATDIDARGIGAVVPGDALSRDTSAPGVGVYDSAGDMPRLRLGSEANRRRRTRFDGSHTTLTPVSAGPDRFGGSWSSAEGAVEAGGLFCALRLEPRGSSPGEF